MVACCKISTQAKQKMRLLFFRLFLNSDWYLLSCKYICGCPFLPLPLVSRDPGGQVKIEIGFEKHMKDVWSGGSISSSSTRQVSEKVKLA